jgi:hypothetical protein
MPCTTYITDPKQHPVTDDEVKEWADRAHDIVSKRIHVEQITRHVSRFFGKSRRVDSFTVYWHIGGYEYQVMNPLGSHSRESAISYLLGLVTGFEEYLRSTVPPRSPSRKE